MHADTTLEFMVRRFGPERVLFGGGPASHNAAAIAALVHAEIEDEAKQLVASGNLQRLLGLENLEAIGITPLSPFEDETTKQKEPLWRAFLRGEKSRPASWTRTAIRSRWGFGCAKTPIPISSPPIF